MPQNVIVIGASGHGRVIADIIEASGDNLIGFLDDNPDIPGILGPVSKAMSFTNVSFVIGIGNAEIRKKIASMPLKWYTAIHPSAVVSQNAVLGEGTVVMANAVINYGAKIGEHCIINTDAVVEHDNSISDFTHVSVGAKLGGTVSIGSGTWIGIGAVIKNNINICSDCIIGAGSVVVKDISKPGTYFGVPAKRYVKDGEMI